MASKLESGIVWVNTFIKRFTPPFGGVKQSGVGREGGFEALHFFTDTKKCMYKIIVLNGINNTEYMTVEHQLDKFDPIDLKQMDRVKLLQRTDTKYLLLRLAY